MADSRYEIFNTVKQHDVHDIELVDEEGIQQLKFQVGVSKLSVFGFILRNRLNGLMLLNILGILFAGFIIWFFVWHGMQVIEIARRYPFSANLLWGYPGTGLYYLADHEAELLQARWQMFYFLVPSVMLAAVGLAVVFYVVRCYCVDIAFKPQNILRAIKLNGINFALLGLAAGGLLLFFNFLDLFFVANVSGFWFWVLRVLMFTVALFFAVIILLTMSALSMYRMPLHRAVIMAFTIFKIMPLGCLIFGAIVIAPTFLVFVLSGFVSMIMVAIFVLLGISFSALAWTCYTHNIFDLAINQRFIDKEQRKAIKKATS
ncbi:MAG: hypothetical protein FWB72_06015 [Firmicutes bacterium]|nr:hypothetical protein [Bacillota bacterium]